MASVLPNDALTAAVIGGLLTGAATLLGALLLRWLDITREQRKVNRLVVGAINTVPEEIAANDARLSTHINANDPLVHELPISSRAYRRVELILAEHLDVHARAKLFEAYAPIEGGDLYMTLATVSGAAGIKTARQGLDLDRCKEEVQLLTVAGEALRQARDRLKT